MKQHFRRLRSSAFARFALSYVLILTIVLACMFAYIFFYVEREVKENTLNSHVNRLSRIAYQHEDYLTTILNSAVQMGLSPDIQPFEFDQSPQKAYELLQQMAPYAVTNSFCDQMFLCFAGEDHLYSPSSSLPLEMFLNLVRYEHVSPEELQAMIRAPGAMTLLPAQRVESTLIDGNAADMVTILAPLGASAASSKGTMIFMLGEHVYRTMFADAIEDINNTYIIHNGKVLISSTDLDVPQDVILSNLSAGSDYHSDAITWNGEKWYLLNLPSSTWDLNYVTLLRASAITQSTRRSMVSATLLVAGLGVVGLLVALLLARRNARPIQEIASMLPCKEGVMDEFSSIQTGIRELSARNTDLITRLERSLPMQRHDFVVQFMKGRYQAREDVVAAAAALGMSIDRPYYAIILHGMQTQGDNQPFDLRKPPFDGIPGTAAFGVELMAIKAHLYLVFSDTRESIVRLAEVIHQQSTERYGHAVVALSDVQTDFADAPSAYLEAATAFDNRFVMDDSQLLSYASISTSIEDILPQARRLTDAIDQALSLRDHARLSGRIDDLLNFLRHTNMSAFAFRLIYNDAIDKLLRRHAVTYASGQSVMAYYDIFTLSSCQSIDDLDQLLRRLCASIIDAPVADATALVAEETPSVISQVADYMRVHFADPELSISAIAEAFEMPTARLSLAFKDEMHMSPLEYLTLLRVERSKELLAATEMSIKEIAAEVGYYDASSFIRRFKQMTGATPLQYRRSKEESNDAHADS